MKIELPIDHISKSATKALKKASSKSNKDYVATLIDFLLVEKAIEYELNKEFPDCSVSIFRYRDYFEIRFYNKHS